MTQNINTAPWYDDFDEFKNYHQILFRPGMLVQARELTQIQSIMRNQIAKFGNHVFKQGLIVIPGNSFLEMSVHCVKVEDTVSGTPLNLALFEGKIIVGQDSGVRAFVKKALTKSDIDPITFYLSYVLGGLVAGEPNGKTEFDQGEVLYVENSPTVSAKVIEDDHVAVGTMAFVNEGVYYINGTFVSNTKQSVVMSKYDVMPSCHVLFKINESVIDYSEDETLLDPAQGLYNFAAPGADRLKIDLELVTLDLDAEITSDYVELMRYDAGVLQEHANAPKYNELEKSLAQRTYDESGDYIVLGLTLSVRENKRTLTNGGLDLAALDYDKFVYELAPGKAYYKGLAIENLAAKRVVVDKARTTLHVTQSLITTKPSWGTYLLVSSPVGSVSIEDRPSASIYGYGATPTSPASSAKIIGIDYYTGSGVELIYKLYIQDLIGNAEDFGRIVSGTFSANIVHEYMSPAYSNLFEYDDIVEAGVTKLAKVVYYDSSNGLLYAYRHTAEPVPKQGDEITTGSVKAVVQLKRSIMSEERSSLVFPLSSAATKNLKNSSNQYDLEYTAWAKLTILTGSTSTSISAGRIVPIDSGTFVAMSLAGVISSGFSLSEDGTTINCAPAASDIHIYCQVLFNNASPRSKTATARTQTLASSALIQLDRADVYEITSVTSDSLDVTHYYDLDTAQTDYTYGMSRLKLKRGYSAPVGNLIITYQYFAHGTTGDFFTIDSYPTDFYATYVAQDGTEYALSKCIDFRKSPSISSKVAVPNTFIETSIQQYMSRIDVVCIDRQGKLSVIEGRPAIRPATPIVPDTLYAISKFDIPAFTYRLNDITELKLAVNRYTMTGVDEILKRVKALEDYSLLTAAETEVTNTPFIDAASGLDRFKTGYLVESMNNPFEIADFFTDGFTASLNTQNGISAATEEEIIPLALSNSSQYKIIDAASIGNALLTADLEYNNKSVFITGGVATLPYYDKEFAKVAVSSRILNVNPFNVTPAGWTGSITLSPDSDIWVESIELPEIIRESVTYFTPVVWRALPVQIVPVLEGTNGVFGNTGAAIAGPTNPLY